MPARSRNVFEQQNRDFIKEQQVLRRELKMQEDAEKEKGAKRVEKMKSRYGGTVGKVGRGSPAPQPPPKAPAQPAGEVIEVFVRETEPEFSHHYTIREGPAAPTPMAEAPPPQPCAASSRSSPATTPTLHSCGSAGGMAGAARKKSATQQQQKPAGHIPAYLKQRKMELQNEKDEVERQVQEQREMQRYPSGHVPLGEDEKEAILRGLNCKKEELLTEINKLPMRYDTTSVRNRRNGLEEQIREIESKIAVFSRKQVFVPRA